MAWVEVGIINVPDERAMWMLDKWGRFSDSLKLFCQSLLIHTGEKNSHNGSRGFDIDKATLNSGLWRKVMVEEISASLLSWWMNVDGEVLSFSVLCLKNNDYQYPSCPGLQLFLWFKLKGLGVFFIWILITMWVELTKKEKKKIDTRHGVTLCSGDSWQNGTTLCCRTKREWVWMGF